MTDLIRYAVRIFGRGAHELQEATGVETYWIEVSEAHRESGVPIGAVTRNLDGVSIEPALVVDGEVFDTVDVMTRTYDLLDGGTGSWRPAEGTAAAMFGGKEPVYWVLGYVAAGKLTPFDACFAAKPYYIPEDL